MKRGGLWKSKFCFFVMVPLMWGTTAFGEVVLRVPSDCSTIQAAVDIARAYQADEIADNDDVVVLVADNQPGTVYSGDGFLDILIDFKITIKSENGPEKCVIDCAASGRAFTFSGAASSGAVLSGFTIT